MRKNYSLFGMSAKVKFCKKCIISNQRPDATIEFESKNTFKKKGILIEENNICSACKFNEMKDKEINWKEREKKLKILCDKYRKKSGYDVCWIGVIYPCNTCFVVFYYRISSSLPHLCTPPPPLVYPVPPPSFSFSLVFTKKHDLTLLQKYPESLMHPR